MATRQEIQDAIQWAEDQQHEFMKVYTYHGHFQVIHDTDEGTIITPEEDAEFRGNEDAAKACGVPSECVETVFGWAARLSAPGYLDCTEWTYPTDTEEEAVLELYNCYGE